jgi:uncharacterized membrane protein YeaQ/YmgE (transglycosylase-associated protein family)
MGVSTSARGDVGVLLLGPGSKADTAACTSSWIDIRPYKGEVLIELIFGTIIGSIAGKIQAASDGSGTGAADVTGATFPSFNSTFNNTSQTIAVPKSVGPFIRFVGTVTTGPIALAAVVRAHPGVA